MSRTVSLRIALLDVQIVDRHRLPIGRVDDIEIELGDQGPQATALITGSQALGERLGGTLGGLIAGVSRRARSDRSAGPPRIEVGSINELEPLIEIDSELDELEHVAGLEHWLSRRFIARLPGSGDESE